MKTLTATCEISAATINMRGLSVIRDHIQYNLMQQLKDQFEDKIMSMVKIDQTVDPMTGNMELSASLRFVEDKDVVPYYIPVYPEIGPVVYKEEIG